MDFASLIGQYTRNARPCHLVLGLVLFAGGLPGHAAAPAGTQPAPAPQAAVGSIDPFEDPWPSLLEMYLQLWRDMLDRWPPPTLPDDLALLCHEFNEGYATVGLVPLTAEEREEAIQSAHDVLAHLALEPELPTPEANAETTATFLTILEELQEPPTSPES